MKGPFYAFNSDLHPAFKVKLPQHSKKLRKTKKLRQMKILRRRERGIILYICEFRSRFKVIFPQLLKKKLRKNVKTKNKGDNAGSELRVPFKVKFSILRKKGEKNEKVQKNDKVDKEKEKGSYCKKQISSIVQSKTEKKENFSTCFIQIRFIYLLSIANSTEIGSSYFPGCFVPRHKTVRFEKI